MSGRGLIHGALSAAAAAHPEATAVVDGERSISYGALDAASDRLASRLIELGVGIGDRVGVYLPKSIEAVIGLYGAMKAGAAYVPLDPSAPPARAEYIVGNCGIRHLVSASAKGSTWQGLVAAGVDHVICLDAADPGPHDGLPVHQAEWVDAAPPLEEPRVIDQDLAYILYTSGSTGNPKGVMLSHRNCLAFVEWAVAEYGVTADDRLSSHAPFHFDLSTFDLYGAALVGAPVYLVPHSVSVFPVEVRRFIERNEITVWYSVPSILTMLTEHAKLDTGDLPSLRIVLFAGEVFPSKYLSRLMRLLPHAQFANLYGPTETNVCTALTVAAPPAEDDPPISIGKAIGNVETFVVDDEDRPVERGTVGELLVRGPTVMAGYWGDPERTASRLTPSPLPRHLGDPVYRTGDLVEELAGGNYRFLGRRDNQIKSRGYRIELGEIEAALTAHPEVVEAAAVAVPDELISNRIVCYVALGTEVAHAQLVRFCTERLPKYMIPETIEIRPTLPKTSTGKIDRQALAGEARSLAG